MISIFLSHQTTREGVASTVRYMRDREHRDHAGKYEISEPRWHLSTADDFAARIVESAEKMHAVRRPSGKKWDSDISQHLAFSFPPGVRLSAEERRAVEDTLLRILCPDSPALIVWHTPVAEGLDEDGKPRCLHPHLLPGSATLAGRHRLTEQRKKQGAGGEQGLLRIATALAVEEVNRLRIEQGREDLLVTPFEAVAAARRRRREAKGHTFRPVSLIVAEALSLNDRVDEQAIVSTLRGLGWRAEKKPEGRRIALTAPGGEKTFFRDLSRLVADTADALGERVAQARGAVHQRDQQQPERPLAGPEVEL